MTIRFETEQGGVEMKCEIKFERKGLEFTISLNNRLNGWLIECEGHQAECSFPCACFSSRFKGHFVVVPRYSDLWRYLKGKLNMTSNDDIYVAVDKAIAEEIWGIEKAATEERKRLEASKEVKTWVWGVGGDTLHIYLWTDDVNLELRPDLQELEKNLNRHGYVFKFMEEAKKVSKPIMCDGGFYSIDGYKYKISHEDLMKIYNELLAPVLEKKKKEQERLQQLIAEAKRTGKPQLVKMFSDVCDGSVDECSVDNVYKYVDGNGNYTYERIHTY